MVLNFLTQLSHYQIFKNSAPWKRLISGVNVNLRFAVFINKLFSNERIKFYASLSSLEHC
jgi:hypothetical protein